MITYRQLWAADPPAWRRAALAWRRQEQMLARRLAGLDDAAGGLRPGWTGLAARTADRHLAGLRDRVAVVAAAVPCVLDQILSGYAERLARAKSVLAGWVDTADRLGLSIDRDGRVWADPARTRPDGPTLAAARRVADGIGTALALAATADADAASRLDAVATAADQGWPERPPPTRPAAGADPAAVRDWWLALDDAARRWLIRHDPGWLGGLDGIPAAARDQANRSVLARERELLLAERDRLLARETVPWDSVPELRRIDRLLAGLDRVTDRLAAESGPRAYLLDVAGGAAWTGDGPRSTGRVVLALGDPDQADNVLTYVPGMGSGLDRVAGELDRTERVLGRCQELAPTELTAAVLWLDYAAPAFVDEAASAGPAERAADDLLRFQQGLRATGHDDAAELTVLGHSYGSLVVGTAARAPGMPVDNLVFVGSPGVGVDHVDELAMPAGQVWATTATNDVIRHAAVPGWWSDDRLWFGHDPNDPGFGARVFAGDPAGHLGYWNDGNPALDAMARIVLGAGHQDEVVTRR
ncbi:alpha/beta hydrolase [Solwaraspora sp. WMMD406]|uniref:alpha/beta hydrolase n=1 Tax=Solwaraspora sp. WMMD406 TaxID=3016095 RepID=UPI002416D558|nr:alpha/beta hydrolase [Solwaraspora sp. WMMD406]MDG4763728.1 alpha/beta hydrolase [Solwaraspora sp. WMMD406]